ncbi:RICIN domain-containing protein [Streptomyces sp. NBC_01433]|nr:RICIN domain-containing protein [Streptomyces sp. NBC_01433]
MAITPPAQHAVSQLVNRRTGKAVDVPGASTGNGAGLIQYTPSAAVNQQFRFVPVGGGHYEIYTTHGSTPLVWSVRGGTSDVGAKIVQWTPEHSTSQQWKIADAGDGYITVTCARSGRVLGIAGDSDADGATVEQQAANGGTGQQWRRVGR